MPASILGPIDHRYLDIISDVFTMTLNGQVGSGPTKTPQRREGWGVRPYCLFPMDVTNAVSHLLISPNQIDKIENTS